MFFDFMAFAMHIFFLQGADTLLTLACFFFFTFLPLSRACFFTLLYLEAFNHLSFLILASFLQSKALSTSQPWTAWLKVSTLSLVTSATLLPASSFTLRSQLGLKIFCGYIIFRTPTKSLWSNFLPVCH